MANFFRLAPLASILAIAFSAWAVPVSPEQALQRISGQGNAPLKAHAQTLAQSKLVYTLAAPAGKASALYVFNQPQQGFLIAPADDRYPVLLGYSDSGAFDPDNIPCNMKWWLDQYAAQIEWGVKNNVQPAPRRVAAHPKVDPLIQTTWNQGAPYNDNCPTLNGERTVTGCVATALAQVLKYHEYPTRGKGTHSYSWNSETLSFDFGSTTFQWSNMQNSYPYSTTGTYAQRVAIATLMEACGVAVNMNYNVSSKGGSAAFSLSLANALSEYFGYDCGAGYMRRDYFSEEEWDEIIYGEIAAGRPVLYGGQSSNGGHEFVCDGYNGDGKYHINWGWEGTSDGYFLLANLNPYTQGIGGGASDGFNSQQDAVIGIKPATAEQSDIMLAIYATDGITFSGKTIKFGSNGGIFAYRSGSTQANLGIKAIAENGLTYYCHLNRYLTFTVTEQGNINGFSGYAPSVTGLPAGKYKVYPVCCPQGSSTWQPIYTPYGKEDHLSMTIDAEGNYAYAKADDEPVVEPINVTVDLSWEGDAIPGEEFRINFTTENSGSDEVSIPLIFIWEGNEEKNMDVMELSEYYYNLDVPAGSKDWYVDLVIPSALTPGHYHITPYHYDEVEPLGETKDMFIGVSPTDVKFDLTELEMHYAIKGENTRMQKTLLTETQLNVTVLPENCDDKSLVWESSNPDIVEVDETGKVKTTGHGGGTAVITATAFNGKQDSVNITVNGVVSNIDDIITDGNAPVDVYNLQGIRIRKAADPATALKGLPSGLYIINGQLLRHNP